MPTVMPPRHHHGNGDAGMPPSFPLASLEWQGNREDAAELRGELRALKDQALKDATRIEKLENENGGLRLSLGEYKGKSEALEKQVLQLMAPKPARTGAARAASFNGDRRRHHAGTDADITMAPLLVGRVNDDGMPTWACRGHADVQSRFCACHRAGQGRGLWITPAYEGLLMQSP